MYFLEFFFFFWIFTLWYRMLGVGESRFPSLVIAWDLRAFVVILVRDRAVGDLVDWGYVLGVDSDGVAFADCLVMRESGGNYVVLMCW